jgi:hypothetical protein
MLGTVAAMFEYDWKEAERHFTTALSGEAVPSLVHRYYAHYCLLPVGRSREAVTHHDIAIGDDPLNLTARSERALALYAAGKSSDSNQELRRILEIDDTFWFSLLLPGAGASVRRSAGGGPSSRRTGAPRSALVSARHRGAGSAARASWRHGTRGDAGGQASARQRVHRSDRTGETYHLHRGELDAAADWTAKAIEQRQPAVFFLLSVAAALRSSPRWPALARRIRLPATSELS